MIQMAVREPATKLIASVIRDKNGSIREASAIDVVLPVIRNIGGGSLMRITQGLCSGQRAGELLPYTQPSQVKTRFHMLSQPPPQVCTDVLCIPCALFPKAFLTLSCSRDETIESALLD